jgi:hypothetical protein
MDAATLPGVLPYLKEECDESTFNTLKNAAISAAKNPFSAGVGIATKQTELFAGLESISREDSWSDGSGT